MGGDPSREEWFADIFSSTKRDPNVMKGQVPCLLRSRPAGVWLTWLGRTMTLDELFKLMGMDSASVPRNFLSTRSLGQAIGNSIPVDLLRLVLCGLLEAAGM